MKIPTPKPRSQIIFLKIKSTQIKSLSHPQNSFLAPSLHDCNTQLQPPQDLQPNYQAANFLITT